MIIREFGHCARELINPLSGEKKACLGMALVDVLFFADPGFNTSAHIALATYAVGYLAQRTAYNAYTWTRPFRRASQRSWERFDRHISLAANGLLALGSCIIAVHVGKTALREINTAVEFLNIGSADNQQIIVASGVSLFAATAGVLCVRRLARVKQLVGEMGGVRNVVSYRSTWPMRSIANTL